MLHMMTYQRGNAVFNTGLALFSIGSHLFKPDEFAFFQQNMRCSTLFDSMLRAQHLQVYSVSLVGKVFLSITASMTNATNVTIQMLLCGAPVCNVHLRACSAQSDTSTKPKGRLSSLLWQWHCTLGLGHTACLVCSGETCCVVVTM